MWTQGHYPFEGLREGFNDIKQGERLFMRFGEVVDVAGGVGRLKFKIVCASSDVGGCRVELVGSFARVGRGLVAENGTGCLVDHRRGTALLGGKHDRPTCQVDRTVFVGQGKVHKGADLASFQNIFIIAIAHNHLLQIN